MAKPNRPKQLGRNDANEGDVEYGDPKPQERKPLNAADVAQFADGLIVREVPGRTGYRHAYHAEGYQKIRARRRHRRRKWEQLTPDEKILLYVERYHRVLRRYGRTIPADSLMRADIRYWLIRLCGWEHGDFASWFWFCNLREQEQIEMCERERESRREDLMRKRVAGKNKSEKPPTRSSLVG